MTPLQQFSRDLEELVAKTAPAVVAVEHRGGQGSGVVLAQDGFVLTNRHVVARADGRVSVRFADGTDTVARVVGTDARTDLAVLRTDVAHSSALALGDSRALRVGSVVVAIGNPLRFEQSVSLGVVSALERSLPANRGEPLEGLVQTDAAINPGNSGGPLLDAFGNVVGINTAILPYAQGIGFAIPAHTASWVTAVLVQKGFIERPYFGVVARAEPLAATHAKEQGQSRGVRVVGVGSNTPAERAGLRDGDMILTVDGQFVGSVDDLQRVAVLSAKANFTLSVLRQGQRREFEVRPQRPSSAYAA
ncbi:MAG: trypsin-like peptidase domain-containing protein [Myxococcales bacterium]|nr:trypsin-like peptidase domain-containing protein [Myxococcales bacterium]